mmetsp:Transcript_38637/g.77940  ORF Transcript_38637/g.77940 Transcript_38637/m.77940 type:complete len:209 (-) Transcript_38637:511-1137(-)
MPFWSPISPFPSLIFDFSFRFRFFHCCCCRWRFRHQFLLLSFVRPPRGTQRLFHPHQLALSHSPPLREGPLVLMEIDVEVRLDSRHRELPLFPRFVASRQRIRTIRPQPNQVAWIHEVSVLLVESSVQPDPRHGQQSMHAKPNRKDGALDEGEHVCDGVHEFGVARFRVSIRGRDHGGQSQGKQAAVKTQVKLHKRVEAHAGELPEAV